MGKRYRINRQWLSITNSRNRLELTVSITAYGCIVSVAKCANITVLVIQRESLARGPKLLSMYTVEQRGFLVRKYWQKQVHLKHSRRHFERNLFKDVDHRIFPSRNWLKVRDKGKPI